jgi:hypothetical protein
MSSVATAQPTSRGLGDVADSERAPVRRVRLLRIRGDQLQVRVLAERQERVVRSQADAEAALEIIDPCAQLWNGIDEMVDPHAAPTDATSAR